MQRDAMVVGKQGDSLWRDMARMPMLIVGFVSWPFLRIANRLRGSRKHGL
jgi:hypothetical protein